MTSPQVPAQSDPPEGASQAEPAAAAPGVTPGHGKHALVTPGDQGDKLSADTAEASPAIGQDAPQPNSCMQRLRDTARIQGSRIRSQ